jgi:predicted HAD superfamily hydrolase
MVSVTANKSSIHCQYVVFYYESIKQELKIKPIYECRGDERLKTKAEESTRLTYTGLLGELEHLKIRLIDEKFASVMGECVI